MVGDESVWSPVRMVSSSLVSAFVRCVYRLVFAEIPEERGMGIKDDLFGVSRTEKYTDPPRRPIIWRSQFLPSFGPYEGVVKLGGTRRAFIRLIIDGEIASMLALIGGDGCGLSSCGLLTGGDKCGLSSG